MKMSPGLAMLSSPGMPFDGVQVSSVHPLFDRRPNPHATLTPEMPFYAEQPSSAVNGRVNSNPNTNTN